MITSVSVTADHSGTSVTMTTLRGEDVAYMFQFLGGFDYVIDTAIADSVSGAKPAMLMIVSELYRVLGVMAHDLTRVNDTVRAAIDVTTVTLFCQTFVSQLAAGQSVDIVVHTD